MATPTTAARPVRSPNPATWTRPERSSRRVGRGGLGWLLWAALAALLVVLLLMALLVAAAEDQHRDGHPAAGTGGTDPAATALVGGGGVAAHALGSGAAQQEPAGTAAGAVAGTVLFAEGSAVLDAQARAVIEHAAGGIRSAGLHQVTVTGHTDVVAGSPVNDPLSRQRAEAVAAALRSLLGGGVGITARAEGQQHPVADNRTDQGRQQNRRAVIQAH